MVFKIRDSVPSPRYSPVCNVLHQWKTSLIPTYRVYRLYDNKSTKVETYVFTSSLASTLSSNITVYTGQGKRRAREEEGKESRGGKENGEERRKEETMGR